jgi:hypothetical protein
VELPERVGPRRKTAALELALDRVEHSPLVVRSGRRRRDTLKDREDLVRVE